MLHMPHPLPHPLTGGNQDEDSTMGPDTRPLFLHSADSSTLRSSGKEQETPADPFGSDKPFHRELSERNSTSGAKGGIRTANKSQTQNEVPQGMPPTSVLSSCSGLINHHANHPPAKAQEPLLKGVGTEGLQVQCPHCNQKAERPEQCLKCASVKVGLGLTPATSATFFTPCMGREGQKCHCCLATTTVRRESKSHQPAAMAELGACCAWLPPSPLQSVQREALVADSPALQ